MFGNHPLPNIAPSLLCFSPPPTHIPPPPPSPLPLANACTGQARARSSPNPVCAPPLVEGCGRTTRHVTTPATSPPPPRHSPPPATPNRHVGHVTATYDPNPPSQLPKTAHTPRHGRRRPRLLRTCRYRRRNRRTGSEKKRGGWEMEQGRRGRGE